MPAILANGITVEVEQHGDQNNPALLLVRGLGSQLIHWPKALIDGFVRQGFYVVTFDNRDTGLSEKFAEHGLPDLDNPMTAPYSTDDMAQDAIGVLDALGVDKAHVFGISMGGMITQRLLIDHADRLLTATIVMSSSGAYNLPPAKPEVWDLMLQEPAAHDRATVIAHTLMCDYAWFSPGYPFDEDARKALIGAAYDRCYDPAGVARQYAAVVAGRGREAELDGVTKPVLVIHGTADTLLPIEHGRDIAKRIKGAQMIEIDGMGHDLERAVPSMIVSQVAEFIAGA